MKKKVYRELYGKGLVAEFNLGFLEADIHKAEKELKDAKEEISIKEEKKEVKKKNGRKYNI